MELKTEKYRLFYLHNKKSATAASSVSYASDHQSPVFFPPFDCIEKNALYITNYLKVIIHLTLFSQINLNDYIHSALIIFFIV